MTGIDPFLMCLFVLARSHKVFHFHLLELARTKNEIAGRDFVAKRFPDLRDAERQFSPAGVQDVEKVYEDALRGFRTLASRKQTCGCTNNRKKSWRTMPSAPLIFSIASSPNVKRKNVIGTS